MDVDTQNIKKWVVLYPIYINSKKTLAGGRRINAGKACENPTCPEIYDCCVHLKLSCAIESEKAYPRDFMQRGRVTVLLKREDGTLCNPVVSSSEYISSSYDQNLVHIAMMMMIYRCPQGHSRAVSPVVMLLKFSGDASSNFG